MSLRGASAKGIAGGEDHISVHHTNEIAQTEACYGTRLANFWLHSYFLLVGEDARPSLEDHEARMSKSGSGFLRVQTLLDKGYDPLAYRLFCLNAHYRARLNFTWDGLDASMKALERLRAAAFAWGPPGAINAEFSERFAEPVNPQGPRVKVRKG